MKLYQKGFTLIELMVVVVIIGIMAGIAAPSFSGMLARSEINTVIGQWRDSFFLAQKEALRRKHRVELCPSADGQNCASDLNNYSVGWIVFDQNSNRLIQDFPPTASMGTGAVSLRLNAGNGVRLSFLHNGRLPSNFAGGNVTIAATNTSANLNSTLMISRSGRLTVGN